MLTVDSYPTSGHPFYSGGDVIAQFLRSLQRPLDPDNFHLASRNLSGRFAVTSRSHQAPLVAGEHAPKNGNSALLRLRMRTAEADKSIRTMLSGGQSAEVRAHIAQVAARREGGPFLRRRQTSPTRRP